MQSQLKGLPSETSSLDLPQGGDDIAEPGLPPIRETDRLSGIESDCTGGESSSQAEDRVMKRLRKLKILRAEIDRDIAMLEGTLGLIERTQVEWRSKAIFIPHVLLKLSLFVHEFCPRGFGRRYVVTQSCRWSYSPSNATR